MAKKHVSKKIEQEPLLNKRVQFELAVFFARHSAKDVNRNLRDLLVDYLSHHPDGAHFGFDRALSQLSNLMRVLDKVEDHIKIRTVKDVLNFNKEQNYNPEFNSDESEQDEYEVVSITPV